MNQEEVFIAIPEKFRKKKKWVRLFQEGEILKLICRLSSRSS